MKLQFLVTINEHVAISRLEHDEDTVFSQRIRTLIVKELQDRLSINIDRTSVEVIEVTSSNVIRMNDLIDMLKNAKTIEVIK